MTYTSFNRQFSVKTITLYLPQAIIETPNCEYKVQSQIVAQLQLAQRQLCLYIIVQDLRDTGPVTTELFIDYR